MPIEPSDEQVRKIRPSSAYVEVTPTLDTLAYADGDRLGSIEEVDVDAENGYHGVKLDSISVTDLSGNGIALDLLFFHASPTVASADNAAIDIADAEIVKFQGHVSLAATDYIATASNKIGTKSNIGLGLKTQQSDSSGKLYVLAVARGAATFAASDLTFKLHFSRVHTE